jgi:hypothetical protein
VDHVRLPADQNTGGIAAAAARRWAGAEEHDAEALRTAEQMPHRIEQADVLRLHARMLLERDGDGDRERTTELPGRAADAYRQMGMAVHFSIARRMGRKVG